MGILLAIEGFYVAISNVFNAVRAHPPFEAGLLLRLMAPPRIKVAAVLYPLG